MSEQLDKLLENVNWKEFFLNEVFTITSSASQIDKSKLTGYGEGVYPYVTRSVAKNGIDSFVPEQEGYKLNKGNVITIGLDTQTVYYQDCDFYTGQNIQILTNDNLNGFNALFLVPSIVKQMGKFDWGGNGATLTRLRRLQILLPATPDGKPDWNFMDEYMRMVEESVRPSLGFTEHVITDKRELDEVEWKEFNMTDVFDVKDGYYNKKPPVSENGTIPFLGATAYNNGVTDFVTEDAVLKYDKVGDITDRDIDRRIFDGNCIVIINDGSVGNVYYQTSEFTCSHSVTPIYLKGKELNKHLALFLSMVLRKTAESFSYARKWRPTRIRKSKLILPATPDGKPDWNFMEQYMKRIENDIMKDININNM